MFTYQRLAVVVVLGWASDAAAQPPGEVPPSDVAPSTVDHAAAPDNDAARIDVGLSATSRALTFTSRDFASAPPSMRSNAAPGIHVAGELYPREASGFGLAGEYDSTLGLELTTAANPGQKIAVDEHDWMIGARYRLRWSADKPSVSFALDYGHRVFRVDRTMGTVDMPDVDYAGFEPGADARVPVGRRVALLAGLRAIVLTSAGNISDGSAYGRTTARGARVSAGVDITVASHAALRVAAEVIALGLSFDGSGAMSNSRDGDPTTIDVAGASDRYVRGSATFALFY